MDPAAAPTPDTMVFSFAFETILKTLQTYSSTTANHMGQVIGPGASVLFGIYMLLWHFALVQGAISEPITDFYKRCLRACIVIMFATTAGVYNDYIADFVWSVPGAIASEISQPGSVVAPGTGANQATSQMLDHALGAGLQAGQAAWDKMSMMSVTASIGYGFMAVGTWLFAAIVCAYAGALVLVANIGTAAMLGLGPIFILLAMFESTNAYFTAWVKQLTTFMIQFLIMASVMTIMFNFYVPFIEEVSKLTAGETIIAFVKVVVMSSLCLLVLHQSQSWAAGLAGGVSITAAGAIGRAVSGAARGAAHTHYNPMKKNKDGTRGGHQLRGAIPSTINGGIATGKAVARAFRRRNSVKQD